MAHEGGIIARLLKQVLSDDAALTALGFGSGRVWRRTAPQDTPLPYIVFAMEPGASDDNAAGARHMANTRYSVRIYTDESEPMDSADKALNRIEEILDHAQADFEGHLISSEGAGMIEGEDNANGRQVRYQGRTWQISTEKIED